MKRWGFLILLGVLGSLALRQFVVEGIYIATPSMEPTLPVDSHYFVNKIGLNFRRLHRGEIVVFTPPVQDHGKELVKRVIGLPGETLRIENKKVFVNGQALNEPYTQFKRKDEILVGDNIDTLTVPADAYFVMGDNRDESGDSRDWKEASGQHVYFVPKANIHGTLMNVLE